MNKFKYELYQPVGLIKSDEVGTVEGRAEYTSSEPQYYVRYKAADGRQVEAWWTESAIRAAS